MPTRIVDTRTAARFVAQGTFVKKNKAGAPVYKVGAQWVILHRRPDGNIQMQIFKGVKCPC